MKIGFCQCNVFLDVFRRPGGKDSVLHLMEATGSLLCQLFASFCQADILILRAYGFQIYNAFLLQPAQGGIDGLLAEAGEAAYFLQRAVRTVIADGIEDPHHAVGQAEFCGEFMIGSVDFSHQIIVAFQFFGKIVTHVPTPFLTL